MTRGKKDLDALVETAPEAEADRDRHRMEEAVLATVARAGWSDPFAQAFYDAFADLSFSGAGLDAIAKAIFDLMTGGINADAVLIRERLPKSAKVSDTVLEGILDGSKAKDATIAGEYIKKLVAQDKRRRALEALQEAKAKVEAGDVEAGVGGLLKDTFDLVTTKGLVKLHPPEDVAALGFLADLDGRRNSGRRWPGLDSGFESLNDYLNGLTEGVFILAGAPSLGKTSLAKQIADHVAFAGKRPVLFFSFEQSARELRIKSLARLSRVDMKDIWTGKADAAGWTKIVRADEDYRRAIGPHLTIIEADAKTTIETIRIDGLIAKRRAGDDGPVLVIIDFLQILPVPPGERLEGIKDRVDWNLSELRRLSRELKSPVLVISSQNRESYKADDRPTLAALKESGGIEYSADAVICLWRNEERTNGLETDAKERELDEPERIGVDALVLKNRNGPLGLVHLNFTSAWADFIEVGKDRLSYFTALGRKKKS